MRVEDTSAVARVLACSSVLMVTHARLVVNQDVIESILATALVLREASHLAWYLALPTISTLALIASSIHGRSRIVGVGVVLAFGYLLTVLETSILWCCKHHILAVLRSCRR